MRLLVEGINPEPWRSPQLGTRRIGRKVVPCAYKDENLRSYQEALRELVEEALRERGHVRPVFPQGTSLEVSFMFWRQQESYEAGGARKNVRARPDVTNMIKAVEDPLQGLLYANDKDNLRVSGRLVAFGPTVQPLIAIEVVECPPMADTLPECVRLMMTHPSTTSGCVWLEDV